VNWTFASSGFERQKKLRQNQIGTIHLVREAQLERIAANKDA
jgi:hypothetical protein